MGNNLCERQFKCVHCFLMSERKGLPCGDELCCATWPQGQSMFLGLFYLVVQNGAFENHRGQMRYQETGKMSRIIIILN